MIYTLTATYIEDIQYTDITVQSFIIYILLFIINNNSCAFGIHGIHMAWFLKAFPMGIVCCVLIIWSL